VSSVVIWLVLKSPSKLDSKDTLTKERRSAQTGKSAGTAVRTKRDQEEQFSTALRLVDASTRNDHNKFEEVLKIIGDYPKVAVGDRKFGRELNAQGLAALKGKNIAIAVELFSKALAADPSDVEVGDNLGYALCLSGAFANAESQLLNVLILAPKRVTAWANLAEASSHQGKDDQAVGAYVTAYKLSRKPEIFLESLKKHAEDPEYESTRDNLMQAIQKIEARN